MIRLFRKHRLIVEKAPTENFFIVTCNKILIEDNKEIGEEHVFSYIDYEAKNDYDAMDVAKGKIGKLIKVDILRKIGKFGIEVYVKDEKLGGFTAFFQDFPNITTQGETIEEAEQNLWNTLYDVLYNFLYNNGK